MFYLKVRKRWWILWTFFSVFFGFNHLWLETRTQELGSQSFELKFKKTWWASSLSCFLLSMEKLLESKLRKVSETRTESAVILQSLQSLAKFYERQTTISSRGQDKHNNKDLDIGSELSYNGNYFNENANVHEKFENINANNRTTAVTTTASVAATTTATATAIPIVTSRIKDKLERNVTGTKNGER